MKYLWNFMEQWDTIQDRSITFWPKVTVTRSQKVKIVSLQTSCARGDTICPALPSPVGAPAPRASPSWRNVAVLSHAEYVPMLTAAPPYALRPRWIKLPGDLDLWSFDLESGVRVTCDVGYLCANFGLPRPLCSRLRPNVRDRQTSDVRQKHREAPIRGGGIITQFKMVSRDKN